MAIKVNISNSAPRELVSEGIHNVVLAGIVDLGMVLSQAYGKAQPKLSFIFATEEKDSKGEPKYLFKRYTNSLHEKAGLRKDFRKLAGRALTEQELETGIDDIEKTLVGRQFQVEVIQETNNGKTYANIDGYNRPVKTVSVPADFPQFLEKLRKKASQKQNGNAITPAHPVTNDDVPF